MSRNILRTFRGERNNNIHKYKMPNNEILYLSGSLINPINIFLSWIVVSGDDPSLNKHYNIYFNSQVTSSETMNINLGLLPYTTYSIYVTSVNNSDEESVPSNTIEITTTNISNVLGQLASGTRPFQTNPRTNITIENLYNVTPISNSNSSTTPVFIDPTKVPFYQYYKIDPKNELFGSTPCGYRNFMRFTTTL
jgi:hypothetical protein